MQNSIIEYIFMTDDRIFSDIQRTKEYNELSEKAYSRYDKLTAELSE